MAKANYITTADAMDRKTSGNVGSSYVPKGTTSETHLTNDCDAGAFRWLRDLNAEALRERFVVWRRYFFGSAGEKRKKTQGLDRTATARCYT